MKLPLLFLTSFLPFLQILPAQAEVSAPLREVNQTYSIQIGAFDQNYLEHDDAGAVPTDYLDKEKGTLGALAVEGRWLSEPWLYQAQLRLATGETAYDGYLVYRDVNNRSVYTPATATTDNFMQIGRFSVGYMLPLDARFAIIPGAEVGFRFWNRAIQGPGGYDEQYYDLHGGLSLTAQAAVTDRLVASIQAAGGSTAWALINVNSVNLREQLGRKPYYRLGAGLDYQLDGGWHIKADAAYERFGYGQSNASEYNGEYFLEPRSRTWQQSFLLGVGYHF